MELQANWKPNDNYALGLVTQEQSLTMVLHVIIQTQQRVGSACNDEMNVRVPRHQINLIGTKIFNKNYLKHLNLNT